MQRMIKSFRDREAERIFERQRSRKLPPDNRLEALSADRVGQHSVRINDRWRICFAWHEGDAYDVEIVDDH